METAPSLLRGNLRHEVRLMHRTAVGIECGEAVTGSNQRGGKIKPRRVALDADIGDTDDITEIAAASRDSAQGFHIPDHGNQHRDTGLAAIDALALRIREECSAQAALNAIEPEALAIRHPCVTGFKDGIGREREPLVLGMGARWREELANPDSRHEISQKTSPGSVIGHGTESITCRLAEVIIMNVYVSDAGFSAMGHPGKVEY
jgi:hypothetical protein